jgi:hypothetical protein
MTDIIHANKKSREAILDVVQQFTEGDVTFEGYVRLKHLEKIIKGILSNKLVKDTIFNEASSFKGDVLHGYEVGVRPVKTNYNFDICEHPELNQVKDLISLLTERKKVLESELKLKPVDKLTPILIANTWHLTAETSGEIVEIQGPLKESLEGIVLTELK